MYEILQYSTNNVVLNHYLKFLRKNATFQLVMSKMVWRKKTSNTYVYHIIACLDRPNTKRQINEEDNSFYVVILYPDEEKANIEFRYETCEV